MDGGGSRAGAVVAVVRSGMRTLRPLLREDEVV